MIGSPVVHYRKTGFFLWVLKKGAHKFVCCFPLVCRFFQTYSTTIRAIT